MEKQPAKKRKLDMSRNTEFRYLLKEALNSLPENTRGAIFGAIYSRASKRDIREARDYIIKIKNEGIINEEMAKRLIDLIFEYSKYY
ncbi:MAG: hypothetical protein RXP30_02105 [Thermoplasmata archaeon]|jgi:hypothetical protein|nr:hypothetical protein [Euryarchaeota archaeon]MVT14280.1 hypothetical protein [Euryarchaeota archaeon]MVT36350.1 hypothetical protein [Euryarchaeota archaeon]